MGKFWDCKLDFVFKQRWLWVYNGKPESRGRVCPHPATCHQPSDQQIEQSSSSKPLNWERNFYKDWNCEDDSLRSWLTFFYRCRSTAWKRDKNNWIHNFGLCVKIFHWWQRMNAACNAWEEINQDQNNSNRHIHTDANLRELQSHDWC